MLVTTPDPDHNTIRAVRTALDYVDRGGTGGADHLPSPWRSQAVRLRTRLQTAEEYIARLEEQIAGLEREILGTG